MFFFPDKKTPILFQGITSDMGIYQTQQSLRYGTYLVAGVSKGKNFMDSKIPLYTSVAKAVRARHPKVSVVFSTPQQALPDVLEAIKSKIPLIICTTEHVPMHDALKMKYEAEKAKVTLLGPSSAGILNVNECLAGTIPTYLFQSGKIAVVGRSSSLIYEAVSQLSAYGLGVSKCVSLGADHLISTSFVPIISALFDDKSTKAILVIGQVHGTLEEELAHLYQRKHPKKMFFYIPGKALARSDKHPLLGMKSVLYSDIIAQKKKLLQQSKIYWIDSPDKMGKTIHDTLKKDKK